MGQAVIAITCGGEADRISRGHNPCLAKEARHGAPKTGIPALGHPDEISGNYRNVLTWDYSNCQRVDRFWKYFSQRANTTVGRTAKTGSFMDRMPSSIEDISHLYLRSYGAKNFLRAARSAISATPSTIMASLASSVQITQCGFALRFRALRDVVPVLNRNLPSCQRPQTTML